MLSKKLKTNVHVAHVRIDFLDHFLLQGMLVEDQRHDTLLYAGEAQVRIADLVFGKEKTTIRYFALYNTYVHLYRTAQSKEWNYAFIEDAFSSPTKKDNKESKPFELDLKKIELGNVRFHMDDKWIGEDMDYDIGSLLVDANGLDMSRKTIDVNSISIKEANILLYDYKGGRPAHLRPKVIDTFDVTPFNSGNWIVKVKTLSLDNCTFRLKADERIPEPGHFDEGHLDIRKINVAANTISIAGDTILGNVTNLNATERCGLVVKAMKSKVSVSPVASICSDLYLETGYSKLQNYYAMHYKHFPDFLNYIDSVQMVAHMKDAHVDIRDIAFFAPQLKSFPPMNLLVTGDGKGTVANVVAKHMNISDGNVVVKGDVTMKGLPDIYTTYITFTSGEILTTGNGIMHYVPDLRNNSNVAIEKLTYAYFKGKYEGYIENFAVNGLFKTNLGTLVTNVKMKVPGFHANSAVYTGTVSADKLQIGTFFRQPLFGDITFQEKLSGNSFNPDLVQLTVDGNITEIGVNGYNYHNIQTSGILAKKQFDGKLLVDDPNLALEFDGGINYSGKEVKINATAHLLGSDFKALNLTADNITASADFDLNCTGSNIDNFSGYAKLFNIDMKRNTHKLDIDSIYVNATGDSLQRHLTVNSDAFVASIKGNYQLSKLPTTIQYYLSNYIPNYIKPPLKYAPEQSLEFAITTTSIDSIFAVTYPMIRGFDSAVVSGSLNTTTQKLTLNANIPYASVGKFHMSNIAIEGVGNFGQLGLNTTIENIAFADTFINASLSLTTTVAHDSIAFSLATVSPDKSNSITLNGEILARKDSLFFSLLPSQFYFNQAKWDIAGGSKVVYSDKYLLVQGISLTSGIQRISAGTQLQNEDRSVLINTENLDLAQFGSWAGLAIYQPDGRLNGTIKIDKIFDNLFISANLKATDVKFGADTVGTVNIIGSYDGGKQLLNLDPQTGIYRDNASIVASGNISLDSATHQKLDGFMEFNNAPVAWAAPFLTGLMSHMGGVINGRIGFDGSSYDPVMKGKLDIKNAALRLDYTGCNYTIPAATVNITNKLISFGNVELLDVYKNTATLYGYFSHNLFKDMRMRITMRTEKFEVLNITSSENSVFYGNVIASMDSFTVRGPFNNIRLNAFNAAPAAKSRIYIPVSSGGNVGTYNYVSFKTYGTNQEKVIRKSKDKMTINLDANLNPLIDMHIIMDASTGDEISANGSGNIQLEIPPSNDMHITGLYTINSGTYTLTFKQLFINRQFRLNQGSTISFNGPFAETNLNVDAVYSTKAKLYDLLSDADKLYVKGSNELIDAQTPQWVDVILHFNGPIYTPRLTFDLDLEDKHSQGSLASRKLMIINNDDRQKFDQVGSLLLIGDFIPPDNVIGSSVITGGINNVSQIISSTASTGLTNIVNKIAGDHHLNVAVKYTNYNYNGDQSAAAGINRNQLKLGVTKNYFNDRLLVSVGSTSDWGKPASTSATTNFNITGDFRLQYLLSQNSGLRLNAFRSSDYDLTLDRDIVRSGVGISWRKSFDNVGDFFHGNAYLKKKKAQELKAQEALESQKDSVEKRTDGQD